jgi:hypothetical protein
MIAVQDPNNANYFGAFFCFDRSSFPLGGAQGEASVLATVVPESSGLFVLTSSIPGLWASVDHDGLYSCEQVLASSPISVHSPSPFLTHAHDRLVGL